MGSFDPHISEDVVAVVASSVERMSLLRQVDLLSFVMGEGLVAGPASQYCYYYARRQGYDIPPFPLAGCGEIKEFFSDQGVSNVPEWYSKIGIDEKGYTCLHERTIVVVRDAHNRRMAYLLDGEYHTQDKDFLSLSESGVALRLGAQRLRGLLQVLFDFLVRGNSGGRPLF